MKIIGFSNLNDNTVSDYVVCDNLDEHTAKFIHKALMNTYWTEFSTYSYIIVADSYELYENINNF